ncbi:MAG: copper-containing nitrite reductase [Candidatus Woesearchaeota archaeon]|nr:copper-containing nitrite reductase [Candidatus Woesearchaeota archaeon]
MHTFPYEPLRILAAVLFVVLMVGAYWHYRHRKQHDFFTKYKMPIVCVMVIVTLFVFYTALFAGKGTTGHLSVYYFGNTQGPFEYGPELPLMSSIKFFLHFDDFKRVEDIASHPANIPPPLKRNHAEHVTIDLVAEEVIAELADGTTFNYWVFNEQVPGPMLRVRVGDTITVNLKNEMSSLHMHSVDFHATTGPGGGAKALQVPPGETRSLTWKALAPGAYIYHCASKHSVGAHNAHGQYGLIIVEPEEGFPLVDREFYVVQGEFYTRGKTGDKGFVAFDSQAMLDEMPNYVVFNGRVNGINGKMEAKVGERVRIFFGNGGVAKTSAFHVIGEIFDNVHHEAGTLMNHNVQTTLVPAGGATIVDFLLDVPGDYILVDHALARMDKGAWGAIKVTGEENHDIFRPHQAVDSRAHH